MRLDQFDFALPPELIAQFPVESRADSRLLTLDGNDGALHDRRFAELPMLLSPGDVLVLNDTRVLKARLFATKETGGKVELLVERVLGDHEVLAILRASHPPRAGARLQLADAISFEVLEREGEFYRLRLHAEATAHEILERYGAMPLPPYIERAAGSEDEARYQTVYARHPGAVAAPTAGLHFDEPMLQAVRERGVETCWLTLHVGAGTFQPVRHDDLTRHRMHSEAYAIPQSTVMAIARTRRDGGRVIAVGTTTLRALEASAQRGELTAGEAETDLFITPGFRFRVVDRLLTNFHLPRSTLLILVAAFAGVDHTLRAYAHAVEQRYRFFSYGDAMLIDRRIAADALRT